MKLTLPREVLHLHSVCGGMREYDGLLIDVADGMCNVVATNGMILIVVQVPQEYRASGSFFINADDCVAIAKTFPKKRKRDADNREDYTKSLEIKHSGKKLLLACDGRQWILSPGEFHGLVAKCWRKRMETHMQEPSAQGILVNTDLMARAFDAAKKTLEVFGGPSMNLRIRKNVVTGEKTIGNMTATMIVMGMD